MISDVALSAVVVVAAVLVVGLWLLMIGRCVPDLRDDQVFPVNPGDVEVRILLLTGFREAYTQRLPGSKPGGGVCALEPLLER